MDHSEHDTSILKFSPSGVVQAEIPLPKLSGVGGFFGVGGLPMNLPDDAIVFNMWRHGRSDLFIGRTGVEPQPLLNTPESAGMPGVLLGADNLAFIIGAGNQPRIAIASLHDGRVLRRFPTDARRVTALTAPADGKTIYYASNGTIWAQEVSGGEPRKIGEGYDLAIEPSRKALYLMRTGVDGYQLFRMPATGGEATRIIFPSGFNLTPQSLSSSAVSRDGRILLPVNTPDVFFYQAAFFDPTSKTIKLIPVPPRLVVASPGWTSDGNIAARVGRWSSSLWRYRNSLQNNIDR
jgi:hypothetical protein